MAEKLHKLITGLSFEDQIKVIKQYYGVKVRWNKILPHKNAAGEVDIFYTTVILNKTITNKQFMLSTLFHEIGHIHCYRHDIWVEYHKIRKEVDFETHEKIKRTGLKAERWVEKWGEKEMKKWYPYRQYASTYDGAYGKKWMVLWYKRAYGF